MSHDANADSNTTESASDMQPSGSATRRSVLAAGVAGIASTTLTTSVAGNPGEQGPYLTTEGSSSSGVYTGAADPPDVFLRCEPDENVGFDDLNSAVHDSGENRIHIYYYDGFREDADRLSGYLTAAQEHVHQYLKPPVEHESIIVLYPGDKVSETDGPASCYGGETIGPPTSYKQGEAPVVSQQLAPSIDVDVTTGPGQSSETDTKIFENAVSHVWHVAELHRDSLERARIANVQESHSGGLHPTWFAAAFQAYLRMTHNSPSSVPLGYNTLVDSAPGEWAERATVSEVNWDEVNMKDRKPVAANVGAIVVEYIVEQWSWKKVLETYFGTAGFWTQIQTTLGVTRQEFEEGLDGYINMTYQDTEDGGLGVTPLATAIITALSGGVGAYALLDRLDDGSEDGVQEGGSDAHSINDNPTVSSDEVLQAQLQDISGIGPAFEESLNEAGFETVAELADGDVNKIAMATGIPENNVSKCVEMARKMTEDESNGD